MYNRNLKIGLLLLLSIVLFYFVFSSKNSTPADQIADQIEENEKVLLEEGDLIMRRGFGFISNFILKILDEEYSITHIGILTKRENTWFVAHSLSNNYAPTDGVQLQALDEFVADSYVNSILITRLKDFDLVKKKALKTKLDNYLDLEIPFDHRFNYKDTTAFYCSQLPLKILEQDLKLIQFEPNLSDKEKYHSLRPFYDKKYFDIIINHHQ